MTTEGTDTFHEQRELGRRVATTPHSDLSTELVAAFGEELTVVEQTLDDDPVAAGGRLRAFWDGYVTSSLPGSTSPAGTPGARLEQAFRADVLGMDLYQALDRLYDRLGASEASDTDPEGVRNWARRVHELSREHYQHLHGHLH
jgi:hypothetical protein